MDPDHPDRFGQIRKHALWLFFEIANQTKIKKNLFENRLKKYIISK